MMVWELNRHRQGEILVRRTDPFHPVVKGDFITNEKFDHNVRLKFYLGTKPAQRSRSELRKFIEENGGIVTGVWDSTINYFVPGTDEESDRKLKEARQWGLRIMTTGEVFHWFGKPKSE